MRELRINVTDQQRTLHTATETGWGHALIAALTVEPETIEELPQAMARFFQPAPLNFFDDWRAGLCEEDWGEGLLVVDLAARLLVYRPDTLDVLQAGELPWHLGDSPTEIWLPFEVPADWRFYPYDEQWRDVAEQRRAERLAAPLVDAREVLYEKLCPNLAEGCLQAKDDSLESIRAIHADWLLTPRAELLGMSPRDVLMERRELIDADIQRQAHAWTRLGEAPAALSRHTVAYRYAGFGTHEIVLYYELVRHLLHAGMVRLHQGSGRGRDATRLTRHLERLKHQWLHTPQDGLSQQTPSQVIDLERCRLPLQDRHDHADHDDCPLCQMMAEAPGPSFWFLDGCNMDTGFAFSFCADEEEWEAEQASWREWSEASPWPSDDDDEADEAREADVEPRLWRSSFFNPDFLDSTSPGIGVQVLMFDVGAKLGELGEDLQGDKRQAVWAKALVGHFANLRTALRDASRWQVDSVRRQMDATIDKVAAGRRDLIAKCDDLRRQLDRLLATAELCAQPETLKIDTEA